MNLTDDEIRVKPKRTHYRAPAVQRRTIVDETTEMKLRLMAKEALRTP